MIGSAEYPGGSSWLFEEFVLHRPNLIGDIIHVPSRQERFVVGSNSRVLTLLVVWVGYGVFFGPNARKREGKRRGGCVGAGGA